LGATGDSIEAVRLLTLVSCAFAAIVAPAFPALGQTATPAGQQPNVQTEPRDLINADRPGIADGSGVLAPGIFQLEIGFQREFSKEDQVRTRVSFLPTLVRVGLGAGFEARVETNAYDWEKTDDTGGATHDWAGLRSPSAQSTGFTIRTRADGPRSASSDAFSRRPDPARSGAIALPAICVSPPISTCHQSFR
jgi:hypothetical protein